MAQVVGERAAAIHALRDTIDAEPSVAGRLAVEDLNILLLPLIY